MVGCCGCARPASVQPRKTYNTLVGALFEGTPIATHEPINSSLRRKIQKLQEYVQVNPAKIPKVSRRLMRKTKATLRKPGKNLGFVKVAVHAYIYMLARSVEETSSYSPSFFAREVVSGPDAVVPLLLKDIHIEMRTLGAELLAVFAKVQSRVDSWMGAIQAQVPQVCRVAQAALVAESKEQKVQQVAKRRRAGDKLADKLAVPNPLDLVGRFAPAHVAALELACLRCLSEVVRLCRGNKELPAHLAAIQAVTLDNLRKRGKGAAAAGANGSSGGGLRAQLLQQQQGQEQQGLLQQQQGLQQQQQQPAASATDASSSAPSTPTAAATAPGPPAPAPPASVVDPAFYAAMGIAGAVPAGHSTRQVAGQLLALLVSFTRDIATVHRVMASFYEYLDEHNRWQEADVVRELLARLTSSGSLQQFPLYSSLLRHSSNPKLSPGDCAAVVAMAADRGAQLDASYSLAALALALHQLPLAWAEQARRGPRLMPVQAFLELLRGGTHPKDPQQQQQPLPADSAPPPAKSGGSEGGSDRPGDAAAFKQQIAHLKQTMLDAVRQLACRLGTAAELAEAVAGVLGAAGRELGLHRGFGPADVPIRHVGLSTAGGAPSTDGTLGGGPGAADHPAAAVATEAAAAAMMAQSAAAAADAFMRQGSAAGTSAAQSGAAAAAATAGAAALPPGGAPALGAVATQRHQQRGQEERQLVLPGGTLPANLLAAALPLLRSGSPTAIRRPVQRALLALLPAAKQGVASNQQAGELAEATLAELRRVRGHDPGTDDFAPAAFAAADGLLRCCVAGPRAPPSASLAISRWLMLQQRMWQEAGYRSVGGASPARAHAVLLLANSMMAAMAEATGSSELPAQQLPLSPEGCPGLRLTTSGLEATGAPFDAHASQAALDSLDRARPPSAKQGAQLEAALLHAPRLVAEYGDQLQPLLEEHLATRRGAAAGDGHGDKHPLSDKVNLLLTKRMSTLRKDLVHVSELMRDSFGRMHDMPSASSIAAAGGRVSDPTGSSLPTAGGSDDGVGAGVLLAPPLAAAVAARGSSTAAAAAAAPSAAPVPAANGGAHVSDPSRPIAPEDVKLQLLRLRPTQSTSSSGLVATVAAALDRPAPGAYVVKEVKISHLAGELEPVASLSPSA